MPSARNWWKGIRSAQAASSAVPAGGDIVTTSDDGGIYGADGSTALKNLGGVRTSVRGNWNATSVLGVVADMVGRSWLHYLSDGSTLVHKLQATKATIAGAAHSSGIVPSWQSPYLAAFTDSVGRAFLAIMPDGTVHAWNAVVNKTLTVRAALNLGTSILTPSAPGSIFNPAWAVTDPAGRAWIYGKPDGSTFIKVAPDSIIPDSLRASTEIASARGSRTGVDLRVGSALNPYGFVKGFAFRVWDLKWTRMLTRRLIYGLDGVTQFDIVLIGDSYTQAAGRWSNPFWLAMKNLFGDAGVGWVGFSYPTGSPALINGSVRGDASVTITGTWTPNYQGTVSPDLGEMASSTAGDTIVVLFPSGQATAKLYYKTAAGASITAQFDGGGASQTVDLSLNGSGAGQLGIATLTAPPAGATHLTLTVAGGTATLCGCDIRKNTSGIRVHKIASTGSRAAQWAAVDPTSWNSGIAALTPQLVVVMHGTNDQSLGTAPNIFAGYLQTIINNLNTALNRLAFDGLLMMPAENQRGLATTMASYSAAAQPIAESNLWCFADFQLLFGPNASDYAAGGPRPWYFSDNIHPDPPTGGRLMADAVFRLVAYSE